MRATRAISVFCGLAIGLAGTAAFAAPADSAAPAAVTSLRYEGSVDLATGRNLSPEDGAYPLYQGRYYVEMTLSYDAQPKVESVVGRKLYTGDPDIGPEETYCATIASFKLGTMQVKVYNEDGGGYRGSYTNEVRASAELDRADDGKCDPRIQDGDSAVMSLNDMYVGHEIEVGMETGGAELSLAVLPLRGVATLSGSGQVKSIQFSDSSLKSTQLQWWATRHSKDLRGEVKGETHLDGN